MAKIEKIEDLRVWQKSMDLCDSIFRLIVATDLSKDFGLRDQMNRSSISIPSKIAGGFERNSNKSLAYFMKIAKGSAGEPRTQLHLAKRRNYINESEFEKLSADVVEVGKMLGSFISYLKNKENGNFLSEPEVLYETANSIQQPSIS